MNRTEWTKGEVPKRPGILGKKRVRIDNWSVNRSMNGFTMTGHVTDHPRINVGEKENQTRFIHTSLILRIDFELKEAETLNTTYILGDMDE